MSALARLRRGVAALLFACVVATAAASPAASAPTFSLGFNDDDLS